VSAAAFKDRLRGDLKGALEARASGRAATLRRLIGAVDNAEAVEVADKPYRPRAFGDPAGEVARRELAAAPSDGLLARDVAERLHAAADYDRHPRADEARRLRDEAAVIGSYSGGGLQN
jgi:uncharacterized protein YqeY